MSDQTHEKPQYDKPIVFFDGYCVLCTFFSDWLLSRSGNLVYIASLQGETARKFGLAPTGDPDSVVLWMNGKPHFKSEAVILTIIEAAPSLGILKLALFLPRSWTDALYEKIAKIRYRLFGKRSTCRLPTAEEAKSFLP